MRFLSVIGCLALLVVSTFLGMSVSASDLRAPLLALEGPMRFVCEAEGRDESSVKFWSTVGTRQASQVFMDHGTSTVGYTNLIFNQQNFRVADIFANSHVPTNSEAYLALLRTARIKTNASYAETAIVFGTQWMYPVYEDRGRFGMRARVPFKYVEIEREDMSGVPGGAQLEDVMTTQPAMAIPGGTGATEVLPTAQTQLMRFDFAEALTQSNDLNSVFDFSGAPLMGYGRDLAAPNNSNPKDTAQRRFAIIKSPVGIIPRVPEVPTNVAVALNVSGDTSPYSAQIPTSYKSLPADGSASSGSIYILDSTAGKYRGLLDDNAADGPTRRAHQRTKETLWLVPFGYEDSTGVMNTDIPGVGPGGSMQILNDLTSRVTENVYQWMHARGYDFETAPRQGLGDLDFDLFYQQDFLPDITTEVLIGLRVPIDRDKQFFSTPYKPRVGNGGHWEARFGGSVGWTMKKLVNLRAHGAYSFVLPEVEEIPATFKGSTIKGVGPRQEANVEWRYATLNLDCTLFHPDSNSCSAVVGYQFYWKGLDKVSYKVSQAESWLGKKYNTTTKVFDANLVDLDGSLLAINTDSVAHRLRLEVSLRIGSYCEVLFGGAYTLAGKHVARDLDTHFGVHLTF